MRLFLASCTQWRRAGMAGVPVGLDYTAVAVVMDAWGMQDRRRRRAFAGLQVMEMTCLEVWAENR